MIQERGGAVCRERVLSVARECERGVVAPAVLDNNTATDSITEVGGTRSEK